MSEENKISEDEARLYDRQIRLWGVEAQNKWIIYHILSIFFAINLSDFTTEWEILKFYLLDSEDYKQKFVKI